MNQTITILSLKLKSVYNKAFRSTGQRKFKSAAIILLICIYLIQLHLSIKSFFYEFEVLSSLGPLAAANLLSVIFTGLFLFMALTSFFSGVPIMFKAADTNFLLAHNIGGKAVFSSKFTEAISHAAWIPLIAAIPLITAYGSYFNAPLSFYPLSILSMMLMLLLSASSGIIASVILSRIFNPSFIRFFFFAAGISLAVILLLAFRKIDPAVIGSPETAESIALNFIERISSPSFSLRPDYLAADGIINLGYGRTAVFIGRFLILISVFILIYLISISFISNYFYAPAMLKYREKIKKKRLRRNPKLRRIKLLWWVWNNELRNFLEDVAYWPQSVILLAVFFIFASISIGVIESYPDMRGTMLLASNQFTGIMIVLIAGRYVYTSVSQESGSYWIMRSAPVSLSGWMVRKFSIYLIIFACAGSASVLFYLTRLGAGRLVIGISIINIIVLALLITSLGYLCGVIFADFRENDVWLIASNTGGIIFIITGFLIVMAVSISYTLPAMTPESRPETGLILSLTGIYSLLVYLFFRYATELLRRKDIG